jgi:hypothetical protein
MNKPRALAPPPPTIVSLREQVAPLRICRKSRAGAGAAESTNAAAP